MIHRILTIDTDRSFFLFGPRGVGKSTFLRKLFSPKHVYCMDFLDFGLLSRVIAQPAFFSEILHGLSDSIQWVILDEVQKVPFLLDEVHRQIELNPARHFAMTGSSARTLRRGQSNLLAGRAFTYTMSPFTQEELGAQFHLEDVMQYGSLPSIFSLSSDSKKNNYLRSYAQTYLQEEIQMEGVVRQLMPFQKFLPIIAKENGQVLSIANIARSVGVDNKTIRSYLQILEDTLLGFYLPAFKKSYRDRQTTHPKFYFFDSGVKRSLAHELTIPMVPGTTEFGRAFEHVMILEIVRHNAYAQKDWVFSYFATPSMEVDLVIETPRGQVILVEFKSSDTIQFRDLRSMSNLIDSIPNSRGLCVCRESQKRQVGNVLICPWRDMMPTLSEWT